jgi:hypothetical protein
MQEYQIRKHHFSHISQRLSSLASLCSLWSARTSRPTSFSEPSTLSAPSCDGASRWDSMIRLIARTPR